MSTVWPEGCGGRVRVRPRLGWMDGVKVALEQQKYDGGGCRQFAKEWRALVRT